MENAQKDYRLYFDRMRLVTLMSLICTLNFQAGVSQNSKNNQQMATQQNTENRSLIRKMQESLSGITRSQSTSDLQSKVKTYEKLGQIAKQSGNYQNALQNFSQALKLSEQIRDHAEIAIICIHMGSCYNYLGYYNHALQYLNRSLNIASQAGFHNMKSSIYQHLAFTYTMMNQHHKADHYRKLSNQP